MEETKTISAAAAVVVVPATRSLGSDPGNVNITTSGAMQKMTLRGGGWADGQVVEPWATASWSWHGLKTAALGRIRHDALTHGVACRPGAYSFLDPRPCSTYFCSKRAET